MFVKDERDLLNTNIFLSVENEENDNLELNNPTVGELSIFLKKIDEVKEDTGSLDEIDNYNDDNRGDKENH